MTIPVDTPPMPNEGQPIPAPLNLRCVGCGYSLTGLISRVCPECGEPFDPLETFQTNVKDTWEFHFTYRRPLWQYVVLSVATVSAMAGFVAVGGVLGIRVYGSPRWYVPGGLLSALILVPCYLHEKRGPFVWVVVLYVLLVCAVVAGLIP